MEINLANPWHLFAIYLVIINILTIILFGIDKRRAGSRKRRIPNATLLGLCILGGSIGGLIGMSLFLHKKRTWYYYFGIPFIIFIQLLLIAALPELLNQILL